MMSASPISVSRPEPFELLARPVQRWVHKKGWPGLSAIQDCAIPAVLAGGDVILAASTASGKTEAAFLPLITRILAAPTRQGFSVVYISPLKALINDQHERLENLCESMDIAIHPWHGDVADSTKTRARNLASGILLITPESLEAMLMRRGNEVARLFGGVSAFVIDELHAFIGSERGMQLISLLHRIEVTCGRRIDRIGLSATLGDMRLAAEALRPGGADRTCIIDVKSSGGGANLDLSILTYVSGEGVVNGNTNDRSGGTDRRIAEHLYATLHGSPSLIFCNSRADVENVSDQLRQVSERGAVANEFLPHHGKLSKELREDAESRIKDAKRPTTIVATSTLEMGVDIGAVETVAQIGAPSSVAALRQRIGRSGRRQGRRPTLRLYAAGVKTEANSKLKDRLHLGLVRAVAVCELLREGWCEPPIHGGWHLSTLAHQILSTIVQHSGRTPQSCFDEFCGNDRPFSGVTAEMFMALLRHMASEPIELIEQSRDGHLHLGPKGERIAEHFTVYAVFHTPEEYRVVDGTTSLGTIEPDPHELQMGSFLIFAGRRWIVTAVEPEQKIIRVKNSSQGAALIGRGRQNLHAVIAQRMHHVLSSDQGFDFVDADGARLLCDARAAFAEVKLDQAPIQPSGQGFDLYPWLGTRELRALALALMARGLDARESGQTITVHKTEMSALAAALATLARSPPPSLEEIEPQVNPQMVLLQKFDYAVPPNLRVHGYLREHTDLQSVPTSASKLHVRL